MSLQGWALNTHKSSTAVIMKCKSARSQLLSLLYWIFIFENKADGFLFSVPKRKLFSPQFLAKGFGASPKPQKTSPKQILKQLQQTYGGTSPQDIARGTQRRIDATLLQEPPHIQLALRLYQQLQQLNYRLSTMSILEQAKLPVEEMEGAKRAQGELDRLMNEYNFSERNLHNILQQATWDASADAKAARSITGEMPLDVQKRVQKGCDVAVQQALTIDAKPKVLDVGCGFGVLVPFLRKSGISEDQIHGIDLSSEMIRNAEQSFPNCHWNAGDFFSVDGQYQGIIFCSSLHDMPDLMDALRKSRELLCEGGSLVILHPQGASHVLNQVRSNPTMVPRGLPTASELEALAEWNVLHAPAAPKSQLESNEGYLAVLRRVA